MSAGLAAPEAKFASCFASEEETVTVVFLHGLLRPASVMHTLARRVEEATGWKTVCLSYPSRSQPLQALAEGLVEKIKAAAGSGGRVFAITHSMGAIVLRHIMGLQSQGDVKWVGCILLCPPNNGSAVARIMSQVWGVGTIFGFIYGRAGVELGQEVAQRATPWPDPPTPCGIIAGNKSLGMLAPVSWLTSSLQLLPGGSDGTVTVEETKLPGVMCAFATVHATHAALINDKRTAQLVLAFLHSGQFPEGNCL